MFASRIARRYARALLALAQERDAVDEVQADLQQVRQQLEATPELQSLLEHPVIPATRKKALVRQFFEVSLGEVVVDFLCLLVDNERANLLAGIMAEFEDRVHALRGVVPAKVTTAIPLTEEQRRRLVDRLKQLTQAQEVILEPEVDPTLIAGAVIQIQDRLIDGSVKTALERLRDQLKAVRVAHLAGEE